MIYEEATIKERSPYLEYIFTPSPIVRVSALAANLSPNAEQQDAALPTAFTVRPAGGSPYMLEQFGKTKTNLTNSCSPPSSNPEKTSGNPSTSASSTGNSKKRSIEDTPDDASLHRNGGNGNPKRPRKTTSSSEGTGKRWACPYYQKEPHRYCTEGLFGDYRNCSKSPGFSEVHRVK